MNDIPKKDFRGSEILKTGFKAEMYTISFLKSAHFENFEFLIFAYLFRLNFELVLLKNSMKKTSDCTFYMSLSF